MSITRKVTMNPINILPVDIQNIIYRNVQEIYKHEMITELKQGSIEHDNNIMDMYYIDLRNEGKANMNPNFFSRIHEGHHGWYNVSKPTPHHHKESMIHELMFESDYCSSQHKRYNPTDQDNDIINETKYVREWYRFQLYGAMSKYDVTDEDQFYNTYVKQHMSFDEFSKYYNDDKFMEDLEDVWMEDFSDMEYSDFFLLYIDL